MRILLVTDKPPWPPDSGGAVATANLIAGLACTGARITLVTIFSNKHPFKEERSSQLQGIECIIPVFADTSIRPVKLFLNYLFSGLPYSRERFRTKKLAERLTELEKTNFDVALFDGLNTTLYIDTISKLSVRKIIFRPHNVESTIWKQLAREERNLLKRTYFKSLSERLRRTECTILQRFDGLAAMTDPDLAWFRSAGVCIPSVVIKPGIEVPASSYSCHEMTGSVAYIGSLDWKPNIRGLEWFIRHVWPLVIIKIPLANFHIAGRNPGSQLERRLKGVNISFHGQVDSSADFIGNKSVIVSPLFSGSGIRIKILESMSLSRAVVATSTASSGLICTDGEDIFIHDNPAEFADTIVNLLLDKKHRHETGSRAAESVRKNYNNLEAANKLINFLSCLPDAS